MLSEIYNTIFDKNINLEQGKIYKEYKTLRTNLVLPYLSDIENNPSSGSSGSSITSYIETLDNDDSINNNQQFEIQNISEDERKYNQLLSEYTNAYRIFMENVMKQNELKTKYGKFFGKTVHDGEGSYIYINDFGVTHKYKSQSWDHRNKSCPEDVIHIENYDFSKLPTGPEMETGQPCKIAGTIIKNQDSNEYAWVDIKGYKHIYSKEAWKNRSDECKKRKVENVTSSEFNIIHTGSPMKSQGYCDKVTFNPYLWENVIGLNEQLLALAMKINDEINKLNTNSSNTKGKIDEHAQLLDIHTETLREDKDKLDNLKLRRETLLGELESSSLKLKATKIKYFLWVLAVIIMILLLVTAGNSTNSLLSFIIVIVFIGFLIYKFFHWFSRQL